VHETTDISNTQNLIVYIRMVVADKIHVYFLGVIPLVIATAAAIFEKLMVFLTETGISEEILLRQLIGFCSDGASCMTGQFQGVAKLFRDKIPHIKSFHCMAHRLELAVKNAVDSVNFISHFRDFIDAVYKMYSLSPKNERELEAIASKLCVELLKIRKVFDIRWVFSSYLAMKAVWQDFPALYAHFLQTSQDLSRNAKERSKCEGLCKKIKSWFFVAEVAMLKDALYQLMQLSLYFQSDSVGVTSAQLHINALLQKLLGLKETNGTNLAEFLKAYEEDGKFKGVEIVKCPSDDDKFGRTKCQFFQALHDNVVQRFPHSDLLKNALIFNPLIWPSDKLELALFGDRELVAICKDLCMDHDDTIEALAEFTVFKQTKNTGAKLKRLINQVETYPISTASCERGFSQLNLAHTKVRNRLYSLTVSSLLMININGPPVTRFNARKYVITWLKQGHHSADDKSTGKKRVPVVIDESTKLFI
jgi:hAT family C-terminal dimerisation region